MNILHPDALAWLSHATDIAQHQIETVPLSGATSSSLFLVQDGRDEHCRFVLRLFDRREWLAEEPDLVAHEAAALQEARKTGLATPELIACTEEEVGFGAPVVLMSYLPGRVELRPTDFEAWLAALAQPVAQLHRHTVPDFAWRYSSWVKAETLAIPAWTTKPKVWEEAIAFWQRGAPAYAPVFIHRDYHPVNVLWQGKGSSSRVSGVVDWVNACRGPASADVAHCRTNLAQMFGVEAADRFLQAYLENAGGEYNPFWDVDSVLDMSWPEPQFYAPWHQFGLDLIPSQVLQRRIDDYLESVMRRA